MSQLSLFSAEARPPRPADLAGLLCGPGRIVRFGAGDQARISIALPDPARTGAVLAACAATGIPLRAVRAEDGAAVLRSSFRCDLVELAVAWTGDGGGKAVPPGWHLDGAALRLWALAAGRPDERGGYVLDLDPDSPGTHDPLIAATTRAGIPPARVEHGVDRGPALRISGARRVRRLVELVGPVPERLTGTDWPRYWGRSAS